jgi:hypothetical protein
MGRSIQYKCICLEQKSSLDIGERDTRRSIHHKETRSQPLEDILLPSVHTCSQGKENEARAFIGYSETSKAYRIYILKHRHIDISMDVTFDEETTFRKSRESHMDEDREEQEDPKATMMIESTPEEHILEYHNEIVEPEISLDPPKEVKVMKKRPTWIWNTL